MSEKQIQFCGGSAHFLDNQTPEKMITALCKKIMELFYGATTNCYFSSPHPLFYQHFYYIFNKNSLCLKKKQIELQVSGCIFPVFLF